jgi:hypothetical protein
MSCQPETRQESDGKLEYKSGNMGRKGNKAHIEHPTMEDKMVEHIIKHPFQSQVQAATTAVTKQIQRHDLPERRIEEVDDGGQQLLNAFFYVTNSTHHTQIN